MGELYGTLVLLFTVSKLCVAAYGPFLNLLQILVLISLQLIADVLESRTRTIVTFRDDRIRVLWDKSLCRRS